jgi:hypothetical protein
MEYWSTEVLERSRIFSYLRLLQHSHIPSKTHLKKVDQGSSLDGKTRGGEKAQHTR